MRHLGATTAELHVALASGDGRLCAEPISRADLEAWRPRCTPSSAVRRRRAAPRRTVERDRRARERARRV